VEYKNLTFRKARIQEIKDVLLVLSKAFEPYKKYYTNDAFNATVLTPNVMKDRILNKKYEIFVVLINKQIIGTVSLSMKDKDQLYIRSMAVHPDYQKRGVGLFILKKINELTIGKNIKTISLDTSKPLKRAIKFYKNFGFKFTGIIKDFYGNEIYEMKKIE
jgi:N-acetylglutamate synthase-like GNAT family acetyltransferase